MDERCQHTRERKDKWGVCRIEKAGYHPACKEVDAYEQNSNPRKPEELRTWRHRNQSLQSARGEMLD